MTGVEKPDSRNLNFSAFSKSNNKKSNLNFLKKLFPKLVFQCELIRETKRGYLVANSLKSILYVFY